MRTRTITRTSLINASIAGIAAAMLATITAAPALASESQPARGVVIAADATVEPVMKATAVVGIDANLPRGLTVSGHAGKPITLTAPGAKAKTVMPAGSKPVAITGLTAGKAYRIAIGGKLIGAATPLATPAPTTRLTVATTDSTGAVELSWAHTPAKGQGVVEFIATAAPVGVIAGKARIAPFQVTSIERTAVIDGLDADTLYEFSVIAKNTAASGKASTATMTKPLSALVATPATPVTPTPAPAPVPAPVATPAAPSSPSTGGGGSSAPVMRTEWYCADSYTLSGQDCTKAQSYTFSTETTPYTYTWTAVGSHQVVHPPTHCDYLPNPNSPTGLDIYCYGGWTETVIDYANVKDATPTGWTDNGSAWTRQVKDTVPAGYTDNGATWVKTIPAQSRQVPA